MLGAIIAVAVFVLQKVIERAAERRARKRVLSAKLRAIFDKHRTWDGNPASMPAVPNWVNDPTEGAWCSELLEKPFGAIVRDFVAAREQGAAGLLARDSFWERLGVLEKRLP